jgi:hypothetical protein
MYVAECSVCDYGEDFEGVNNKAFLAHFWIENLKKQNKFVNIRRDS